MVLQRRRPSGFIEPCLPSKVARPPSGLLWVQEMKHDGPACCVHQADNRTTASTTTLRTTVAIAATSMFEIRLAMRHFWRQSSDRLDLDQAVSGGAPGA
jgi:hypothetical protein